MAYPPLGYPYSPTHQFLMPSTSLASCLEPGGRSLVDSLPAPSHPSLTCPVYENRVISSPGHELTPPAGIGVYSGAYQSQGYYSTCSRDVKALYSRGTLDSEALSAPAPAYYPYDYAFGQYSYDRYGYASPDAASRRKNTNRETTSTLKAWLQEHQKNPYPTKGEKIMLAIITKMTLTQVSTWFANARRRLKKENKVTWSQRANKGSDDRGLDDDSDGREESVEDQPMKSLAGADLKDLDLLESDASDGEQKHKFDSESVSIQIGSMQTAHPSNSSHGPFSQTTETIQRNRSLSTNTPKVPPEQNPPGIDSKPKTWSIAQTAVSLNSNIQPEYLSCMLSFTGASDMGRAVFHRTRDSPSDMGRAVSHRTQDSPSDLGRAVSHRTQDSPSDLGRAVSHRTQDSPSDLGRAVSHRTQDSPSDMGRAVSHRTQDSPSDMGNAVSHRTQDSSVAMLREWVDGVFHDPPLFNPQPVNQTTVKQTTAWKWLNTFSMETQGHLFEHTLQHV